MMKTQFWIICLLVVALLWCLFLYDKDRKPPPKEEFTSVRCDKGDSLGKRIANAKPGQTFVIQGTCEDDQGFVIDQDNVTLIGGILVGGPNRPAVTVTGKNATIRGLVAKQSQIGILVKNQGSVHLNQVSLTDNSNAGLCILGKGNAEKSSYTAPSQSRLIADPSRNCMAIKNPDYKQPALEQSTHKNKLKPINSSYLLDFLISEAVAGTCTSVNTGCNVDHRRNGYGIFLQNGDYASLINCSVELSNNRDGGVFAAGSSTFCTEGTSLRVTNNDFDGLYADVSTFSFFAGSRVDVSGQQFNVFIENGSRVECQDESKVNPNGKLTVINSTYDESCEP